MNRSLAASLVAATLVSLSSAAFAQETPPAPSAPPATAKAATPPAATEKAAPPAASQVKLDLVVGEVRMLALDDIKSWTVEPEGGVAARAVDDGHSLRVVGQKDGAYTIRMERNDGSVVSYAVQVGPPPANGAGAAGGATVIVPKGPIGPEAPAVQGQSADEKYARNTIDLNLEGGIGRHFGDSAETFGFGRARAGVMFARWPVFTMIGATYEYNNLSPATFGIQGELLHLSAGIWGQLGGMVDVHGKLGVMAAFGISIIGVEAQYRGYEDVGYGAAVLAKLRLPLGVIMYALDLNKKK